TCRFCGGSLAEFVDLGMSPLCESYLAKKQLNSVEPFYPLAAYVCRDCLLVQLQEYVAPENIFSEYAYFLAYSDAWLDHARRYVEMMTERLGLGPESRVIEIGSNDGHLLQFFVEGGIPVLGIDPAANVAKAAEQRSVPTLAKFFGVETARQLAEEGSDDCVIALEYPRGRRGHLRHFGDCHDCAACLHRRRQLQLRTVLAAQHRQRARPDLSACRGSGGRRRLDRRLAGRHSSLRSAGDAGPEGGQRRPRRRDQLRLRGEPRRDRALSRRGRLPLPASGRFCRPGIRPRRCEGAVPARPRRRRWADRGLVPPARGPVRRGRRRPALALDGSVRGDRHVRERVLPARTRGHPTDAGGALPSGR